MVHISQFGHYSYKKNYKLKKEQCPRIIRGTCNLIYIYKKYIYVRKKIWCALIDPDIAIIKKTKKKPEKTEEENTFSNINKQSKL